MLETPQTTQVNGGEADVTLRLEKRAVVALSGVVTDTDGNPIAGAHVQAITLEGQYGHGMGTPEITDAKGRYRIAGLSSSGRYSVDARADGYGVSSAKVTLTLGQNTAKAPAAAAQGCDEHDRGHRCRRCGTGRRRDWRGA